MLRALGRETGALDGFLVELGEARGGNRLLDAAVGDLERELRDPSELETRARRLTEAMAVALQAALPRAASAGVRGGRLLSRSARRGWWPAVRDAATGRLVGGDRLPGVAGLTGLGSGMGSDHLSARARERIVAAALIGLSFFVYNANFRVIGTGDSMSSRFLPLAVWGFGTVSLEPVADLVRDGYRDPYWMVTSQSGGRISTYSPITPLLVTPLYAPAALYLHAKGWHPDAMRGVAKLMEKLSASFVAALTVGLVFLVLRRRVDFGPAFVVATAYAFGTSTWMISSQALWQHGATQLFCVLGLLVLTRPGGLRRSDVVVVGLLCGLLVANRPADAPLAGGLGLCVLVSTRDRAAQLLALTVGAALVIGAVTFNVTMYGSIIGGYTRLGITPERFGKSPLEGIVGILLSPGRGLFAYAPFLAFVLLRLRPASSRDHFLRLDVCLAAGVVALILVYATTNVWRSAYVYGPRMLASALPLVVWLLAPVVPALRRVGRIAFGAAVFFSVGVQVVGAFWFPGYRREAQSDLWYPHLYPPYLHFAARASPFDLPGVTRPLWLLQPLELNVATRASVHGDRVEVEVDLAPEAADSVPWPFSVEVFVASSRNPEEPGFFGSWRVQFARLEEPTTVRFHLDPVSKSVEALVDGAAPEERDVVFSATLGPAEDGEFVGFLKISPDDSPRYPEVVRVFTMDRRTDEPEIVPLDPIPDWRAVLRMKRGRP